MTETKPLSREPGEAMIEALLPCPFCGASLKVSEDNIGWTSWHRAPGCILSGHGFGRADCGRWNTRAAPSSPPQGEVVEAIAGFGGRCRDCADNDGICESDGLPCDPVLRRKAIGSVLRAADYYGQHPEFLERLATGGGERKACATCGFPWGQNPAYHAEFCDNRTLNPSTPEPPADLEERARELAEGWVKDRGDAPYQGIARSVAKYVLQQAALSDPARIRADALREAAAVAREVAGLWGIVGSAAHEAADRIEKLSLIPKDPKHG